MTRSVILITVSVEYLTHETSCVKQKKPVICFMSIIRTVGPDHLG